MKSPLVSIIVPIYNVEEYLDRCLTSIANQTYSNIEVIMINDGSTDKSKSLAQHYLVDNRFMLFSKENGGLSSARNFGLKHAKGDYVAFVDSDDYLDTRFLTVLVDNIISFQADICCCDYLRSNIGNISGIVLNKNLILSNKNKIHYYLKNDVTSAWGKLYKRDLFEEESFPEGMLHEDIALNFRLFLKANKVIFNSSKLYVYFARLGSTTMKPFSIKNLDLIKAWEEIASYKLVLPDEQKALIIYRKARAYFNLMGMIALYGFDCCNIDIKRNTICYLKRELHNNFGVLFFSPYMPLNRKVALVLFEINFSACCYVGAIIKKIKF